MELYGKESLFCNRYDNITVYGYGNNLECRVLSKSKKKLDKNINFEKEYNDAVKDSEKFLRIVNNFLANNKIDSIKQDIKYRKYYKHVTQITSGNRELSFFIDNNDEFIKRALINILYKFGLDRKDILYEYINDKNRVIIEPDEYESSIKTKNDSIYIKYISNRREDMIDYDQEFILDFLIYYIDYSYKIEYSIVTNKEKNIGVDLKIGDMIITVKNSRLLDSLISYVDEHNKNIVNDQEFIKKWRKYNGNNDGKNS